MPITLGATTAVLIACLVAVPSFAAASTGGGSSAGTVNAASGTWSFGNVTTLSVQGTDHFGGYSGQAIYGFVTNVTNTNTSSTTVEITVQETLGIALTLQYCRPSCSNATRQTSEFSYRAWETRDAWTNLTTASNVTGTFHGIGANVTEDALGILNSTSEVRAFVNESASDARYTPLNSTQTTSTGAVCHYSSNSTVAFTPALGILPTGSIAIGDTWASTASYQASADWGAHWVFNLTGSGGTHVVLPGSIDVTIPTSTGVATLISRATESGVRVHAVRLLSLGYTLGAHLTLGPGLSISWALPSGLGDGLPGTSSWATHEVVGADVQVSALDALPTPGLATRLQSSEISYSVSVLDRNTGANDTVPQTSVAGGSLTPGEAGTTASCLQQSDVCSTTTGIGTGAGLGTTGTVLLVVGSGVVLAALVTAVLVTRQRRIPPPQYPNAVLYPPGQALVPPTGPSDPKAPSRPPAGSSEDPLDQLW